MDLNHTYGIVHPNVTDNTFFSSVHRTFFKIGYISEQEANI